MDKSLIQIFRGDDTDGLGYQSIQGKITTTLDLTGCRAVFRYLGFTQEFDPIPDSGRITITMPASATSKFPPGLGYASLRVYDSDGKVRTFTNRIPVFVTVYAPSECGGEFEVVFNGGNLELEPLKIKSVNGYRIYDGYLEQIIDKATADEYGLAMLFDSGDNAKDANSGYAATPKAVQAAYDAIIGELTDNYYNAEETDEAIDRIAAYYITADAQGNPFATHAALMSATAYYSGGQRRTPTRNDYCVVLADETHGGNQYRYIYTVNQQGVGQWEAQYVVGGSIELDNTVTRTSTNGVKSSGIWSAIWGALTALPGVSSLYDWCVAQLAGKASTADVTLTGRFSEWTVIPGELETEPTIAEWTADGWIIKGEDSGSVFTLVPKGDADSTSLSWTSPDEASTNIIATRALLGYTLGSQSDRPLQPQGDYAPATGIQKSALAQDVQASLGKADTALQTTGGTMTGPLDVNNSISAIERIIIKSRRASYDAVISIDDEGTVSVSVPNPETGYYYGISFPEKSGYIALLSDLAGLAPLASPAFTGTPTAPTPAAGDNSTKVATTAFVQGSLRYDMPTAVALVAENDAATLVCADRAVMSATIAAGFSTLNLTFPEAISGKVRDFYLRIIIAAGESAPALSIPQGITIENPDGAVPEIADGETDAASTTLVWFSETAPNVFTAKSETVKAVA